MLPYALKTDIGMQSRSHREKVEDQRSGSADGNLAELYYISMDRRTIIYISSGHVGGSGKWLSIYRCLYSVCVGWHTFVFLLLWYWRHPAHRQGCTLAHRQGCTLAYRRGCTTAHRWGCTLAHRQSCTPAHRWGCALAHCVTYSFLFLLLLFFERFF